MSRSHQLLDQKRTHPCSVLLGVETDVSCIRTADGRRVALNRVREERGRSPPPPDVEVVEVVQKDVPITKEWVAIGWVSVNAQIRAQVSGYLLKQVYTNGAYEERCAAFSDRPQTLSGGG
jgi:hypothetical protein